MPSATDELELELASQEDIEAVLVRHERSSVFSAVCLRRFRCDG